MTQNARNLSTREWDGKPGTDGFANARINLYQTSEANADFEHLLNIY